MLREQVGKGQRSKGRVTVGSEGRRAAGGRDHDADAKKQRQSFGMRGGAGAGAVGKTTLGQRGCNEERTRGRSGVRRRGRDSAGLLV